MPIVVPRSSKEMGFPLGMRSVPFAAANEKPSRRAVAAMVNCPGVPSAVASSRRHDPVRSKHHLRAHGMKLSAHALYL